MRNILKVSQINFPPFVLNEITSIAREVQAPSEMVVTSILGLMGTVLQSIIEVQPPVGEKTPVGVFTLTINESGDRKSAVENLVYEQVRKFDQEQDQKYAKQLARNTIEKKAWHLKLKIIQKRLAKSLSEGSSDASEIENEYMGLLAQEPCVERCGHLLYSDFTMEALMKKLAERWPHASIASSEASKILQNLSQQVVQLNLLWDGQSSMSVNRKVEGDTLVTDPRLSMSLMIQPEPFNKFRALNGTLAGSTGLFNRMLICRPPSLQGTRMLSTNMVEVAPHSPSSPFQQRVKELLVEGEAQVKAGGLRKIMHFSPEAKKLWVTFYNSTESWMGPGGSMEEVKGYASKAMNNMARIAAILTYFAGGRTVIDEATLAVAATLCDYYNAEFVAIFGPEGQADISKEYARALEEWFRRRHAATGKSSFRMGELYKEAPGSVRKKAQLEVALELLCVEGRVMVMKTQHGQPYAVNLRLDRWGRF